MESNKIQSLLNHIMESEQNMVMACDKRYIKISIR